MRSKFCQDVMITTNVDLCRTSQPDSMVVRQVREKRPKLDPAQLAWVPPMLAVPTESAVAFEPSLINFPVRRASLSRAATA